MAQLYADIQAMVKPSWVTSIPTDVSSTGPKLKSDQWRTLGNLYLPVTLIRLWSDANPQDERAQQRRKLLHLTMLLFSAIAVGTSRVTSEKHAVEYLKHILAYCEELKSLFPDYHFRANHHMAIHIHKLLLCYGPVHGWWTFPYERMIGMLQRFSTNHKLGTFIVNLSEQLMCISDHHLGEYEETIARSWYRSVNF